MGLIDCPSTGEKPLISCSTQLLVLIKRLLIKSQANPRLAPGERRKKNKLLDK